MLDIKLRLIGTDNNMVATRWKRVEGPLKVKGGKHTVTEDDLTLGCGHIKQYTHHVS